MCHTDTGEGGGTPRREGEGEEDSHKEECLHGEGIIHADSRVELSVFTLSLILNH